MQIQCLASKSLRCTPETAFALMVDPARFPPTFTGYGPIPAIRSITLRGPLAVGAKRRIENTDGSVLEECVTALEPPHRHAYSLAGFRPPFSWLVSMGNADWTVTTVDMETRVRWQYVFTLASAWVYPLAWLLLEFFMARAMQRCLDNMARVLEAGTSPEES